MDKPNSQQRGLAGEYYVASMICRMGYDVGITIGRAKIFDMVALGPSGKEISIQVKATYTGYDWLVRERGFAGEPNSVVALVRLGRRLAQRPELYFLPAKSANQLITHEYANHSPRISRREVMAEFGDHDLSLIEKLLGA